MAECVQLEDRTLGVEEVVLVVVLDVLALLRIDLIDQVAHYQYTLQFNRKIDLPAPFLAGL